jgi:hypothetical protein
MVLDLLQSLSSAKYCPHLDRSTTGGPLVELFAARRGRDHYILNSGYALRNEKNNIAKQWLDGKGSKTNTFNLRDFFKKFSKKPAFTGKKAFPVPDQEFW